MRIIVPALMAIILLITACAAQKKAARGIDVSYVQLWRTACFGTCPTYKLDVFADGTVRYTPLGFVPDTGIFEKNIGTAEAAKILARFSRARVDTMKERYDMPIADLPGINYTFKYGNTVKKVYNAQFGPLFGKELANEMDMLLIKGPDERPGVDGTWRKVADSPKGD